MTNSTQDRRRTRLLRRWLDRLTRTLNLHPGRHGAPPMRLEALEQRIVPAADLAWGLPLTSTQANAVHAVVHDAANNTYIAGEFSGTADFGQGVSRTSSGGIDAFAAMYDPSGKLVWAASFGGNNDDRANAIAVDPAGNVVVAGDFQGSMTFNSLPTLTSNGARDAFVVGIANPPAPGLATIVTATSFGGAGDDSAQAVEFNGSAVLVAGTFLGSVDFDPGAGQSTTTAAGATDGFIWAGTLANNTISFNWVRDVGGNTVAINDSALGATGLYVTGSFNGNVNVHGANTLQVTLASAGSRDAFVARYDLAGNLIWARGLGGTGDDRGEAIGLDRGGNNIAFGGEFQGTAIVNDTGINQISITSGGGDDVFVSSLASDGAFNWARSIGGPSVDALGAIAVAPSGNVFLAGTFTDTINLDPGNNTPNFNAPGLTAAFIDKLNAGGSYVYGEVIQGQGVATPEGLAINALGDLALVGRYTGVVDFDPGSNESSFTSVGLDQGFLVKLADPVPFFNEDFYLASNPDVAANVGAGKAWRSGLEHFETYGITENRRFSRFFNEADYLALNPDVAADVGAGKAWSSGFAHFLTYGRYEGRNVTPLFDEQIYLRQNPDVAANAGPGRAWASGYEHYLATGMGERRPIVALYDEATYLASNPDVAADVGPGRTWATGLDHYLAFGINEDRKASPVYFESVYLANNPDVAADVGPGRTWQSGLVHYLMIGQYEGRTAV